MERGAFFVYLGLDPEDVTKLTTAVAPLALGTTVHAEVTAPAGVVGFEPDTDCQLEGVVNNRGGIVDEASRPGSEQP